jgi:hypothetical protein
MSDRPEYTLLGTDNASIWAEEFCRLFDTFVIVNDDGGGEHVVDPGTMIGWFANAMQTAVNMYERRALTAKEEQQEAFVEGFQEGRPD